MITEEKLRRRKKQKQRLSQAQAQVREELRIREELHNVQYTTSPTTGAGSLIYERRRNSIEPEVTKPRFLERRKEKLETAIQILVRKRADIDKQIETATENLAELLVYC